MEAGLRMPVRERRAHSVPPALSCPKDTGAQWSTRQAHRQRPGGHLDKPYDLGGTADAPLETELLKQGLQ